MKERSLPLPRQPGSARMADRPFKCAHASHGAADDRRPARDAEGVGERHLGRDLVTYGHKREPARPGAPGAGVPLRTRANVGCGRMAAVNPFERLLHALDGAGLWREVSPDRTRALIRRLMSGQDAAWASGGDWRADGEDLAGGDVLRQGHHFQP
jgi:hypothetical protein